MISTQSRAAKLAATAAFTTLLGLSLAACGSEEEAPATENTKPARRGAPAIAVPPQSAAEKSSAAESEDASEAPEEKTCGSTKGPDGPLTVTILAGDIPCDEAEKVASDYVSAPDGFLTSQVKKMDGWICGPSAEVEGELSRCVKDDTGFSLSR